jgi:hypothetical protein
VAIMPFVRQYAETDRGWFDAQPFANVRRWLAGHVGSDLFQIALLRLQPWQPGDAEILFPPHGRRRSL